MPTKKLNDVSEVNDKLCLELEGIGFTANIQLQKIYKDNQCLFEKGKREFTDFIDILRGKLPCVDLVSVKKKLASSLKGDQLKEMNSFLESKSNLSLIPANEVKNKLEEVTKPEKKSQEKILWKIDKLERKSIPDSEVMKKLFDLDLDCFSYQSFFDLIKADENSRKKYLFDKFTCQNKRFNTFLKQKRINSRKDRSLSDLIFNQIYTKIESTFSVVLDKQIRNIGHLTKDNIDKILAPELLSCINDLIKQEVELNLNEKTDKYLPLPLDNRNIYKLKVKFYNSLLFKLNLNLAIKLKVDLENYLSNIINNTKYEWERKIPCLEERKDLQEYLKENVISKVINPAINYLETEFKKYLNDHFRAEHEKTSDFAGHLILLDKSEKNLEKKLDSAKEKLDKKLTRQFRSRFDNRLIEQASISLLDEEFFPFFILLERDMHNYLKEKLSSDALKEINCFKDMMNFFDFEGKKLQLFIERRKTNKENILLFDDYFLFPEEQIKIKENRDQVESRYKLKSNDTDFGVSDLSSSQARRSSKSSLYSMPLTVDPHHSSAALDTLSKVQDISLEQKKNKSKGKLTKWTCGLFCGHKKTKFDQDEAYSPVRSEFYVAR